MSTVVSLRPVRARKRFAAHVGADAAGKLVELLEAGRLNDFGIWAATLQTGLRPDVARRLLGECGYLERTASAAREARRA